jgi:hypothetical protein
MTKTPAPTFEVRFVAPGLHPEKIPFRSVSDALAAIQDLASGRDPFASRHVPLEKQIGLLKVRRGSAVYSCVSRTPDEARQNLRLVGQMLSGLKGKPKEDDLMVSAFKPIETLSAIAKTVECRLEIYSAAKNESPIFTIEAGDFEKLSSRLLLKGDTTVLGTIVRVGGATGMRCLMRIPQRKHLLYCDVEDRKLVRHLGKHLYEQIAAVGTATWIHRSWHIYKFSLRAFTQPKLGDPAKSLAKLREAGLSAWDKIPDPDSYAKGKRL